MDTATQIRELTLEYQRDINAAQQIVINAAKENRSRNAEEEANYAKAFGNVNRCKRAIEELELLEKEKRTAEEIILRRAEGDSVSRRNLPNTVPGAHKNTRGSDKQRLIDEYRSAWENFSAASNSGDIDFRSEALAQAVKSPLHMEATYHHFRAMHFQQPFSIPEEYRTAQTVGTATAGGNWVTPTKLNEFVIQNVVKLSAIRSLATVQTLDNAVSLRFMVEADNESLGYAFNTETGTTSPVTVTTNKRDFFPNRFDVAVQYSEQLLAQMKLWENYITMRIARDNYRKQEQNFLLGTGSGQPYGMFTVGTGSAGVPSTYDTPCGSGTAILYSAMMSWLYSLPAGYASLPSVRIIINRAVTGKFFAILDNNNRPILQPNQTDILGYKFTENDYAPSSFTDQARIAIIGAMEHYGIVDMSYTNMLFDIYTLALQGQQQIIYRQWLDAMPLVPNAFRCLSVGTTMTH